MSSPTGFVNFKNKTVDCNMQVARGKPCNHQIIFKLFHPDELSGVRKQTTKHNVNIWKGSICAITSNGPAVGLSKRYPTQHPGRVLVPRASGATKLSRRAPRDRSEQRGCKEGTAWFLILRCNQNMLGISNLSIYTSCYRIRAKTMTSE